MPRRHNFYDPIIESPREETVVPEVSEGAVVKGVVIESAGVYMHVDHVVEILRGWAKEQDSEILRAAADSFAQTQVVGGNQLPAEEVYPDPVSRVEIFPDPDGKWHARPVTEDGSILSVTEGDFNRDFVERDVLERWPGKQMFELPDAMGDSIWDEQASTFGFNGRRRPSPKRLWSQ